MLRAARSPDGEYRVRWYQAWRVTPFSEAVDPDTGQRLYPDRKALAVVGAIMGGTVGPYVIGAYWVWEATFDRNHTVAIALATAFLLLSHVLAAFVLTAVHVTFRPARPAGGPLTERPPP